MRYKEFQHEKDVLLSVVAFRELNEIRVKEGKVETDMEKMMEDKNKNNIRI